jgi:hypothetical protein
MPEPQEITNAQATPDASSAPKAPEEKRRVPLPNLQQYLPKEETQNPNSLEHHLLKAALYGLQGYDAVNSANFFKAKPGNHETDPIMKPFSHGGAVTMAGGFEFYNLLRDLILHKLGGQKAADAGDLSQIYSNVQGIKQTNNAAKAEK